MTTETAPKTSSQETTLLELQNQLIEKKTKLTGLQDYQKFLEKKERTSDEDTTFNSLPALISTLENEIAELERQINRQNASHAKTTTADSEVPEQSSQDNLRYITITNGGLPIPVCPSPTPPRYEIIAGRQKAGAVGIEYPIYFSEVLNGNVSQPLRAGERIPGRDGVFSPDFLTIYQYQIKLAHEEIYRELSEIRDSYFNLNPNSPDYDKDSSIKSKKLLGFIELKNIRDKIQTFINRTGRSLSEEQLELGAETLHALYTQLYRLDKIKSPNSRLVDESIIETYVETPYTKQFLNDFILSIKDQIYGQRYTAEDIKSFASSGTNPNSLPTEKLGATIIEGMPGVGKNYLINLFAAYTNRPVFRYVCTPTADVPNELTELRIVDGSTFEINGEILTALTTPNSILILDELNLLHPGVAKFFNSILDAGREISTKNGIVKVAPGVIIVGLMNPNAVATNKLAETIVSRSRIIELKNPPVQDMALISRRNLPQFSNLTDNEFLYYLKKSAKEGLLDFKTNDESVDKDKTFSESQLVILKDLSILLSLAKKSVDLASTDRSFIPEALFTRKLDQLISDYQTLMLWDEDLFKKLLIQNPDIASKLKENNKLDDESKRIFFLIYRTFLNTSTRNQYSDFLTGGMARANA